MQKKKLVVLTGAGISAESGISTFRDTDGLWEGHKVQDVATPYGWSKNRQLVLDFYNMRRRDMNKVHPNTAHLGLVALEAHFDVTIITQNVDDLHERAGSQNIIHLHGELTKMRSSKDPTLIYPYLDDIKLGDKAEDGSQLRPHIVWFNEAVPMMNEAYLVVKEADIFAVIGTSLQVYPAAGLIDYVKNEAPKFIVDPKVPRITKINNLIAIEQKATEGMLVLQERLKEYH